ncbi:MAG: hypothetical protein ACYDAG_06325, partial [Chloroflexota bacterium]
PPPNHLLGILLGLMGFGLAYVLLRLSWLTIVGVPFIPFLIGGVWLATMLGLVAISLWVGRSICQTNGLVLPVLAETLLGFWLLFIPGMIPYLGWLLGAVLGAAGFGAVLQTHFGSPQGWSLEALREPLDDPQASGKIVPLRRVR